MMYKSDADIIEKLSSIYRAFISEYGENIIGMDKIKEFESHVRACQDIVTSLIGWREYSDFVFNREEKWMKDAYVEATNQEESQEEEAQ